MGIKKDRLLRLGNKILPSRIKYFLIKHDLIKGVDNIRNLVWDDDFVVEFWLKDFNGDAEIITAFQHIKNLYYMYLKDDPNWHFIYEGEPTVIRCSYKYAKRLEDYFEAHSIEHTPMANWSESSHITRTYQDIYKHIFHLTAVLTIKMAYNEENNFYIQQAADRIIHVFLLQSIYLAEINGDLQRLRDNGYIINFWEAEQMARLHNFRTYHIGTIDGHDKLKAKLDALREKDV